MWIPTHIDLTLHLAMCIFSEYSPQAAQLVTLASDRLLDGFRPAMKRQYIRMWLDFQSFKVAAGLPTHQVGVFILLSFIEYLFQNFHSHRNMANYLAGLRAHHILHGLNTLSFKDERLALYLKSLKLQMNFATIFKPLHLLCFISFLHLSNILPHSVATFDHTRQLARADYICTAEGAVLLIKWSKTLQKENILPPFPFHS